MLGSHLIHVSKRGSKFEELYDITECKQISAAVKVPKIILCFKSYLNR